MAHTATQRHMPRRRNGHTTSVTIGHERFYLTANGHQDGALAEVFIQWGKQGQTSAGLMDIYAMALSVGLQHGVPLLDLIHQGLDLYFVPNGHTDDPEIPRVRSVVDWVARRLAIDWLPYEVRAAEGIFTIDLSERTIDHEVSDLEVCVADMYATENEERQSLAVPAARSDESLEKVIDEAALAAFRAELASGIGKPTFLPY